MKPNVPRATYRLQLHGQFGFEDARKTLPYLARLGVSHVYCSPICQARAGSTHGYDVVDHSVISPELGGRGEFERLAHEARALGLGILLDQVPNHMGVFGSDNRWWLDVLENGPASAYAHYFDIDWRPANRSLHDKLLLPLLADHFAEVLDSGELRLLFDPAAGEFSLNYHQHKFPLDPASYAAVLEGALENGELEPAHRAELAALHKQSAELPGRSDRAHAMVLERRRQVTSLKSRLRSVANDVRQIAAALQAQVERLNLPDQRDALDDLHGAQAYRLAYWRIAGSEINYRRFFDINDLAALCVEHEDVFEATHGLALDLAAAGLVDGLRIDHPDGLADPDEYFRRLQSGYARRVVDARGTRGPEAAPLYVIAEKIAAGFEDVPPTWAVQGTTGYRFAMVVNGLFVERGSRERMTRIWAVNGGNEAFSEIKYRCKRDIACGALRSEFTFLANLLQQIALSDRRTRDYCFADLADALIDVAACMPVYRTYVVTSPSAQDERFIDWAIAQAKHRSGLLDLRIFDFLRSCLRNDSPGSATDDVKDLVRRFARRFQQVSAPVAAKGVEDTALYRFMRLTSLNEVGADPDVFGISAQAFHAANRDRLKRWPHTMLATSTHDNKRSEDVRNRINVLSEQPTALRLSLRRWHKLTKFFVSKTGKGEAPSAADRYLIYQTLLGTLPVAEQSAQGDAAYAERVQSYLRKAARESKLATSWARPDTEYEQGLERFIAAALSKGPARAEVQARANETSWYGGLNSVSMALLKLTAPGVPDIYQGSDLIDLSLVDPDNRRPVDYAIRSDLLNEFTAWLASDSLCERIENLCLTVADGRLKLWTLWRLLCLRREHPGLFSSGAYAAIPVQGSRKGHAIAFTRQDAGSTLLVVAARKFVSLGLGVGQAPVRDVWDSTALTRPSGLGEGAIAEDVLTGRTIRLDAGELPLSVIFAHLPIAALHLHSR